MDNDMDNNINYNMNNIINNNQINKEKSKLEKVSYYLIYVRAICIAIFFLEPIIPTIFLFGIIVELSPFVYLIAVVVNYIILIIAKIKKLFSIKKQLIASLIMFSLLLFFCYIIIRTTVGPGAVAIEGK